MGSLCSGSNRQPVPSRVVLYGNLVTALVAMYSLSTGDDAVVAPSVFGAQRAYSAAQVLAAYVTLAGLCVGGIGAGVVGGGPDSAAAPLVGVAAFHALALRNMWYQGALAGFPAAFVARNIKLHGAAAAAAVFAAGLAHVRARQLRAAKGVVRQPLLTRIALGVHCVEVLGAFSATLPFMRVQALPMLVPQVPADSDALEYFLAALGPAPGSIGLAAVAAMIASRRGADPASGAAPLVGATLFHTIFVWLVTGPGARAGVPDDSRSGAVATHVVLGVLALVGVLATRWAPAAPAKPHDM